MTSKRTRKVKPVAAAKQPVLMPIMALVEFWLGKREASRRAFVWPRPGTAALCGQLLPAADDKHRVQPLEHCSLMIPSGSMDITDFIFNQREEALVVGDYNAYRAHATRKLHKLRKKLGQTTPRGRKYTAKPPVSAEDIGNNVAYVLHSGYFLETTENADCHVLKLRPSPTPQLRTCMGAGNAYEVYTLGRSICKGNRWRGQTPYYLAVEQGDRFR